MTYRWVPDTCVFSLNRTVLLWHTQGQSPLSVVFSPTQSSFHKPHVRCHFGHRACRLSWQVDHSQILKSVGRKGWLCKASTLRQRLGLYPCVTHFSTSGASESADLSHRMSRLRSTLESVSKAVSGTQADILGRIAWFKPVHEGKDVRSSPEALGEEKGDVTSTPAASGSPAPSTVSSPPVVTVSPAADHVVEEKKQKPPGDSTSQGNGKNKRPHRSTVSSKSSVAPKPATPLFHPGSFTVNLDETYNYVAHHINAYFGSTTKGAADTEEKQLQLENGLSQPTTEKPDQHRDQTPAPSSSLTLTQVSPSSPSPPPSPKKGLSHYLSYSAPTVQAFVGSYIAPLVPKFRTETKTAVAEKDPVTEENAAKEKKVIENKEQKAAEEKAKRLLLQRERVSHSLSGNFTELNPCQVHLYHHSTIIINREKTVKCLSSIAPGLQGSHNL